MFPRSIASTVLRFAQFPVIGILGPRQSGKTTLVQELFPKYRYLNLEDPSLRMFATENPAGFLREYENEHGIILDEFQYVPQILSYIQLDVDAKKRVGYFVLTGSQNFLMNESVTQSLAGRIGILTLLPLSIGELRNSAILTDNVHELILKGSYPRLYEKNIAPGDMYQSYIHSYIERDVRTLVNVESLSTFQRFMQLLAARVGQQLNITNLASECGIAQKTVNSWLLILEASYIIVLLTPYYNKFSKRLTKAPKLYFYDTGLVCSLLNIRSSNELALSSFKGPLFECLVVADLYKQHFNAGFKPALHYWRDVNGRVEVDCLIDRGTYLVPIEIKAGEVINQAYFDGLRKFHELSNTLPAHTYVVYGGPHKQSYKDGTVLGWQAASSLVEDLG